MGSPQKKLLKDILTMKGKISIVTLLVADLKKSISFYRDGLGFPMDNADDDPSIAFFPLEGTWLALYPDERFAGEGVGNAGAAGDAPRFTLAHNVKTKKEVDSAVRLAASAGAQVLKEPQEVFWGGYSGYLADPDGHLWEIAYNPFMDLT